MWHMFWITWASLFGGSIAIKSTTGKEFVCGFLSFVPSCILQLDIASSSNGVVEVYIPYLGMNTTYFFSKTMSLTVNSSLQLYGTQIGHNGVYIKSTVDVSVYISTLCALSEDTYVCLPVKSLERAYYVSSNRFETTGKDFVSLFMVISPFANTEVNISFPNGTSISKTLNWLDVYQETNLNDLTGTIVLASKPVSVVSGHACVLIIDGGNNCDMIGEQMIPTNAFQTHFIVPPILSNKFIVRIFSSKSNNTVCMKNESFGNCTMLGANQLFESAPQHLPLVVTSQEPISVIQYKGTQSYMTTIPGVRQFMNSYTFVRPLVYQNKNDYISVTILSSASQTLRLDGKLPSDQLVDTAHVVPPFNNYTVLTFRITAGYHVMSSTERNVVFGLIVFGFDDLSAYGFPAGMNFEIDACASNPCLSGSTCSNGVNGYTCTCPAGFSGRNCDADINKCSSFPCLHGGTCSDGVNAYTCVCPDGFSGMKCETNIDECAYVPCFNGGTCSDGVNTYTCTCQAGFTGRKCETNSNKQLMCYSCEDMSDLELCDTVQKCGDGDLCTVKYSHSKYSSGCASSSVCSSAQTAHGHCSLCCDENYCNGRGCGDTGLGTRSERGPICFDCNHVLSVDQCQTVRPCYKDEVCSIEEFDWLGHSNYKLGCVAATCTSIDHGRSVPRCKSCCNEDFCNTNCTVRETAAIIG